MNADELRGKADELAALLMSPHALGNLKDTDLAAVLGRPADDDGLRGFFPTPTMTASAPVVAAHSLAPFDISSSTAANPFALAANPFLAYGSALAAQRLIGQRMAEFAESLARTPINADVNVRAAGKGKGVAPIAPKQPVSLATLSPVPMVPLVSTPADACGAMTAGSNNAASPVPSESAATAAASDESDPASPRSDRTVMGLCRKRRASEDSESGETKRVRRDSDNGSDDDMSPSAGGAKECLSEEEKRRRNCVASARFREKKKKELRMLEDVAQQKSDECDRLNGRVRMLEQEVNYLRQIVALCAAPKFGSPLATPLAAPFLGFAM